MDIHPELSRLALDIMGPLESVEPLPLHGSSRQRWRITSSGRIRSAIAVWNPRPLENRAFLGFTEMFHSLGLAVPIIYGADLASDVYIEEDLGTETLYDVIEKRKHGNTDGSVFEDADIRALLRESLRQLAKFQVLAGPRLNQELCYQGPVFDGAAVTFDLTRFLREFIERVLSAHEATLAAAALQEIAPQIEAILEHDWFMYRDFQSRNIMVQTNRLVFIDYQSGRLGPPEYDAVSLLFQSRLDMPAPIRNALFDDYLDFLEQESGTSAAHRRERLPLFVALRALQTLGAYGELGLGKGQKRFITSIPSGLRNLEEALLQIPGAASHALQESVRLAQLTLQHRAQ